MKEKLKNIFKNENLWSTVVEFLCAVLLVCVGYFSGFAAGLLVDDSIRTEIIDNTLNDSKKSKLEPKKANDNFIRLNPNDYYGKYTKVGFNFNDNFIYDFYVACNSQPFLESNYYLYGTVDDIIYLNVSFTNDINSYENYIFSFWCNDNGIDFEISQGEIISLDLNGIFDEQISADNESSLLNELGLITNNYYSELGLDNYYLNLTEYIDGLTYSDFSNYVFVYDVQADKNFINYLIDGAGTLISLFGGLLVSAVLSITGVFYSNGKLTIIGAAMAFALVVGIVYLVFRMVRGLVKSNNRG